MTRSNSPRSREPAVRQVGARVDELHGEVKAEADMGAVELREQSAARGEARPSVAATATDPRGPHRVVAAHEAAVRRQGRGATAAPG